MRNRNPLLYRDEQSRGAIDSEEWGLTSGDDRSVTIQCPIGAMAGRCRITKSGMKRITSRQV